MTKREKIDQLMELLLLEYPPEAVEDDAIVQQVRQRAKALVERGITAENF